MRERTQARGLRIWGAAIVTVAVAASLCAAAAQADPQPTINPYRVWWSMIGDDKLAVEVDDPDLAESNVGVEARWPTRWEFARDMRVCKDKAPARLRDRRDKTLREVRIDTLDGDGQVRAVFRCVKTVSVWRRQLGDHLFDRLEGELDAHDAFLHPRRYPGMPQDPNNPPEKAIEDDHK